jgi:hypothetical protein
VESPSAPAAASHLGAKKDSRSSSILIWWRSVVWQDYEADLERNLEDLLGAAASQLLACAGYEKRSHQPAKQPPSPVPEYVG